MTFADTVRMFRPGVAGVTLSTWILSIASVPIGPLEPVLASLLLAFAFHVFGVLSNDLADRDVDALTSRRRTSPLISGALSSGVYVVLAALSLVVVMALTLWWGISLLWVGSAVAMMAVYNLFGKRLPIPVVMDVVQGLSWGAFFLALRQMVALHPEEDYGTMLQVLSVVLFFTVMNGVHGGLRDVRVDAAAGRWTTPLLLGVQERDGFVRWTRPFAACAASLHTLCCATAIYGLMISESSLPVIIYSHSLAVISSILLMSIFRSPRRQEEMLGPGVVHMISLFMLVAACVSDVWVSVLTGIAFGLPLLAYKPLRTGKTWMSAVKLVMFKW